MPPAEIRFPGALPAAGFRFSDGVRRRCRLDSYRILDAPVGYAPIRTPSRRLLATPTPLPSTPGFKMMSTPAREEYGVPATPTESSLPFIKPEDYQASGGRDWGRGS